MSASGLTIIGTCPDFQMGMSSNEYVENIRSASAQAERQGWAAMLIYSDHKQFDPWISANIILENTRKISPLIATQPLYMHPFTVSKLISSMTFLYNRPIHLNFISGGFPWDLEAFCDSCVHDERYNRVIEYADIIRRLLSEKAPCSLAGRYYRVDGLQLPAGIMLPEDCAPIFTISGSSSAGLAAARRLKALAIQNLRPSREYDANSFTADLEHGTRIGIVARTTSEKAWGVAKKRYPADPLGEEVRRFNIQVSDSVWVKELGKSVNLTDGHPYWLGPFKNGQAGCPFLVGTVEDVAYELSQYIKIGLRTFLVERPIDDEDAEQITAAFDLAERIVLGYQSGSRPV